MQDYCGIQDVGYCERKQLLLQIIASLTSAHTVKSSGKQMHRQQTTRINTRNRARAHPLTCASFILANFQESSKVDTPVHELLQRN